MSAATQNEMERLKKERDAAIEQVAYWRERALDAEGREQALAVHVEILASIINGSDLTDRPHVMSALNSLPETSLARLKAEWQAEALGAYEDYVHGDHVTLPKTPREFAHELRRQAEENSDE